MFGIIADLIASITSIALPAYLSYKSLRTGDPAQTTPWLIYFIVLALALAFESWTVFIIGWLPFYSWFRLIFLLYLVLPQTQGAKYLYLNYVEPYIVTHEHKIDKFIGETHRQLSAMGLGYMNIVVEFIREKILGQASPQPQQQKPAPGAAGYGGVQSYATDLLSRFAMPSARTSAAQATGLTGILSAALSGTAGGASSGAAARSDPTGHGSGFPADLGSLQSFLSSPNTSNAEKSSAIQSQRDKLTSLMRALDKEQQSLDLAYGSTHSGSRHDRPSSSGRGGFPKSLSQQSFERVEYDDYDRGIHTPGSSQHSTPPPRSSGKRTTSGGFMGGWLGGSEAAGDDRRDERRDDRKDDRRVDTDDMVSKGWATARDMTDAIMNNRSDRPHRY